MSRASSELHAAAGSNGMAALEDALRLPPKELQAALSARDAGKNTPLHIASYKGHVSFVSKILALPDCGELSNLPNDNGNTPLHLAVLGNHLEIVRALLLAAQPANLHMKDKQGYTPMHYACGEGFLDIAQVNPPPPPALHTTFACAHTRVPVLLLQLLYSLGSPFDVTNLEGLTPLMCCSQQGHLHIVRFIIDKDPRCVFFCNTAGDTALHYAGEAG